VLVDSKPGDLTVDCDDLRAALSPRTKAVIPVHYAGHPCAMDEIMDIAGEHGLAIIEDAAHPYYRDRYGYRPGDFPAATQEYARLVSLPIYTLMSESAVRDVIGAVRQIILRHRA
jgi:dTDP-4-amino-4,6-dideoxygalactose transaminase